MARQEFGDPGGCERGRIRVHVREGRGVRKRTAYQRLQVVEAQDALTVHTDALT